MSAALLTAVGRTSLSAAVMILAALALRARFQRQTPRRVFCLLWDLVLIRLLVLAEITSPLSIRRLAEGLAAKAVTVYEPVPVQPQVVFADGGVLYYSDAAVFQEYAAAGSAANAAGITLHWTAVLAALWLAGAVLGGLWLLWGHLRSRRLYAASLPVRSAAVEDWQAAHPIRRPVQVRCSDRIVSPLTYGIVYPVVLLPAGMDLTDGAVLSCVLGHEYTHIRRFDALRKGLLALGLCLHWFNPLVWVMYILAGRDIELACDEAVVRGGADRRSYALALLQLEEKRGFLSGSSFSRNALEERIEAIMKRKHISLTAVIAVLAAMSIATTVFAASAPAEARETALAGTTGGSVTKDVISQLDEDGNPICSADGGDDWTVEWWTAGDYAAWLEQEKKDLQAIIGERGYNPTDGWFTWDQQKVDETIALYESILEDIQKGALYSRTIVDKDGRTIDGVALGSGSLVLAQSFDSSTIDKVVVKPEEAQRRKADLFQECAAFGLTGSEKDGLFYNGESVRSFVDGYAVGDGGYGVHYSYYDANGTVDVHTVRALIRYADGSYDPCGELLALVTAGQADFDQGLADCARPTAGTQSALADRFEEGDMLFGLVDSAGYQATPIDEEDLPRYLRDFLEESTTSMLEWMHSDAERGRTFQEIFAQYESYGLACESGEGSFVDLTWNGERVGFFADLRPDGSAFTYDNPFTEEGIRLCTVYDETGRLTGLRPEQSPV